MRLKKIHIEDFKSIKKLEWDLDTALTCLVGQNESGKSNLIEALNFIKPTTISTMSYELFTRKNSDRYVNNQNPFIKAEYSLNEEDKKGLEEGLKPYNPKGESLEDMDEFIVESAFDNGKKDRSYFYSEKMTLYIEDIVSNPTQLPQAIKVIESRLTELIILSDNGLGIFTAPLAKIKSEEAADTSLFKLMQLTDVRDFSKIPSAVPQLRSYLRGVNNRLNERFVQKYYSQDSSVKFDIIHDSGNLYLEINDSTDAQYTIEERSDGFKYFFGLLIEAASIGDKISDIIFILDEPGSKLHPSGQRDLLKYLEELSIDFRIIYTTHSPFMINRLYPNRVRVIEKHTTRGTIFKEKGFSKNWRPMRSALGLTLSDSFYYSDKALIVEGPEDIIYIAALINYYNLSNQINVNTDLFSIIDAGGEGNLPSMVQIMIDEERPTVVLMDSDSQGTFNKIEKKRKGLKSGMLVLMEIKNFKKDAVSIEDLLNVDLLVRAFNNYTKELINDESLILIKGKQDELKKKNLSKHSRYKIDFAPFIIENYSNPNKNPDQWIKEKVPISKVGIARHFEKILIEGITDSNITKSPESLKLIKLIIDKLGLKA